MRINLRDIPEDGLRLSGEIVEDIFELGDGEPHAISPIRYNCVAEIVGETTLVVRGRLGVDFEMVCVRCLEPFVFNVHLPEALYAETIDDRATIDLTESIREDILLALPDHPHCEEADPPRTCPARGLFEAPEDQAERNPDVGPKSRHRWADLEGFEPTSPDG